MILTPLQRALAVAPERASVQTARPEQELFCFRVKGLSLAVPSSGVREVLPVGAVTPLPRTPSYLLGVMGHRGEVLPVLDLLQLLGRGVSERQRRSRLFVAVAREFVACVLADTVVGLHRLAAPELLVPPIRGDAASDHVSGVFRSKWSESGVTVLDLDKLLARARAQLVSP